MNPGFDVNAIRARFPVTQRLLYLDSAHQTPLATSVRDALIAFYAEECEMAGPKPVWLQRVEATRAKVGAVFNAKAGEIAFTKNTSEGLNIAAHALPMAPGDNVVLLHGDHPNAALDLIAGVGVENIERHVLALGDRLLEVLDAQGIALVGPRRREERAHIYVLRVPVQRWMEHLTRNGVRVCAERDGVRVSFAMFNTLDDVARLEQIIATSISKASPTR
jgi:selenocysteine lyase/cysteine desulfurase